MYHLLRDVTAAVFDYDRTPIFDSPTEPTFLTDRQEIWQRWLRWRPRHISRLVQINL